MELGHSNSDQHLSLGDLAYLLGVAALVGLTANQ